MGRRCIDFTELAADIAVEAEQAQVLTEQIDDLDERVANLYQEADPQGYIASAPGVGLVTTARPRPVTRCCAKPFGRQPTGAAGPTPSSPRSTSG